MATASILFLGYDHTTTSLPDWLMAQGHAVIQEAGRVTTLASYDLVISYGYRHILSAEVLQTATRPAVNLHISYLPYNRGAHPNFWSWVEDTPRGVTLHEIDAGLDTGPIIAQAFSADTTAQQSFAQSYHLLHAQMELVFKEAFPDILTAGYTAVPQRGMGTYHAAGDLPDWMDNWEMKIADAITKYRAVS